MLSRLTGITISKRIYHSYALQFVMDILINNKMRSNYVPNCTFIINTLRENDEIVWEMVVIL